MFKRLALLSVFALVSAAALAEPVQLVSNDEAKLPPLPAKAATRAITRGPGVKLLSPESVSSRFPLKIAFEPRGSSKIDPASVKVEYLKGQGLDITDRVKRAVKPDGIELAEASAPAGEHPLRISVRDDEGRQGVLLVNLVVK
ncbi:MAG: hypothetical protein JWP36_75 [Paucimonas sp.]|nr:hypothetical protein [Paucimonas sp.]